MYLFCLDVHANVVIERISDLQQQSVCSKVIDKIIIKLPYLAQIRIVLCTISPCISLIDELEHYITIQYLYQYVNQKMDFLLQL